LAVLDGAVQRKNSCGAGIRVPSMTIRWYHA
jgi:hypothetical protein